MKYDFKIGQLVTPTVESKGYELGDHGRMVGRYYEIVDIDSYSENVKLAGKADNGWLNFKDVKIKFEQTKIEKEDYNYLKKLLKKLNIK